MDALGMIETKGLIAAIEACDVMLKTAKVSLVGKRKSTATLVTILISGDVGAVKASVEAGMAAAEKVSPGSLLSAHVIPRPIGDIDKVFGPEEGNKKANSQEKVASASGSADVVEEASPTVKAEEQPTVEKKKEPEAKFSPEALKKMSVVELRKVARQCENLGIAGREISSANKQLLLKHLLSYFK